MFQEILANFSEAEATKIFEAILGYSIMLQDSNPVQEVEKHQTAKDIEAVEAILDKFYDGIDIR